MRAVLLSVLLAALRHGSEAAAPEVAVELFYLPRSPKSGFYLNRTLGSLLEAELPGSLVRVTVLPWKAGKFTAGSLYTPVVDDNAAFVDLCALKGTMNGSTVPSSASADLASAASFIACRASAEFRHGQTGASTCAADAGLEWEGDGGLQACAEGGEGHDLMSSEAYAAAISQAMSRERYARGLPAVFLNGDPLTCPRPDLCKSLWTQAGHEELESPGSLLTVVCSKLSSPPEACEKALSTTAAADLEQCENCVEVGRFRWRPSPASSISVEGLAMASAGAAALLALLVTARRRTGSFSQLQRQLEESVPPATDTQTLLTAP